MTWNPQRPDLVRPADPARERLRQFERARGLPPSVPDLPDPGPAGEPKPAPAPGNPLSDTP